MDLRPFLRYRVVVVVLVHAAIVTASWYGAWWLRLDTHLTDVEAAKGVDYLRVCNELFLAVVAARLFTFAYFDLFQGLWRYVSLTDLVNLVKATVAGSLLYVPAIVALTGFRDVPRSVLLIEPMLCLVLVGGVRFAIRTYREVFAPATRGGRRVLVVGAGDAGEMVLREMRTHRHLGYDPVGFADDDVAKWGTKIHGVPVLGEIADLRAHIESTGAEEVVVAIRSARGDQYSRVLAQWAACGVRIRRLPRTIAYIVRLTELRDVDVEDLLEREPVAIDVGALRNAMRGKVVLVTGAGGSIGSEAVRQLAPLEPALVVADSNNPANGCTEITLPKYPPTLRLSSACSNCLSRNIFKV